ncbi:DinB family protein [Nocardia sp. NPDC050175]|uniref:mycothiol transferase n=1 Tax=Nocardia sp. NPDC050175 TaxID=3364317 RepID=UPI0037AF98F2
MTSADLLIDAFGRVQENVHGAVADLTTDELAVQLDPGANSIAWLIWHLTRVQDDHVADVADIDQVWTTAGWAERFGLPFDDTAIGYGDTPDEVAELGAVSADLLLGYYDAVHAQTIKYVSGLTDADLPRVVDTRWNPPVTLAVRLISVVDDDIQHSGQAAFVRGVLLRRR